MKTFELTPVNGRKSFYGKCKVLETENTKTLFSYGTDVATFDNGILWITKNKNHLTNTTLTHISAFLHYLGLPPMNKKQILKS